MRELINSHTAGVTTKELRPLGSWRHLEHFVSGGLFLLLTLLCLSVLDDYGMSSDEQQQRNIGLASLKYAAKIISPNYLTNHPQVQSTYDLATFWDRDYGVAFELPAAWLEQAVGTQDWVSIYRVHHLCTMLVGLAGVIAVYQLARRRFASWPLGLLAASMLVLSPRLFADYFYNSKDLVFMAVLAIATNTAVRLIQRPSWGRATVHALTCALAIDVRIMGLILPAATLALMSLQLLRSGYSNRRTVLAQVGLYVILLVGLVVLAWPFLWEAPWNNFLIALHNMSLARWRGEVFFAGRLQSAEHLPWYYAPVWIGLTTPLVYLFGFLAGAWAIVRQVLQRGWHLYTTDEEWQDLLFLGLVVLPLVAVAALHSVLYNGWRQLYFVYPPLLLVALRGLIALAYWRPTSGRVVRWWPWAGYAGLGLALLTTAGQQVALHPLQNTYFNLLAGVHVDQRFEIDYWTISYRQGLEWIAAHDTRPHIVVVAQRYEEAEANRLLLPPYQRDRLEVTRNASNAEYFLTTYHNHPEEYNEYAFELMQLRRGGNRILSVYRTKW